MNPLLTYPQHHPAAFAAVTTWCLLLGVLATRHQALRRGYFSTRFHGTVERCRTAGRFRRYRVGIEWFASCLALLAIFFTWHALR
jgi:hypothetical protein